MAPRAVILRLVDAPPRTHRRAFTAAVAAAVALVALGRLIRP